MNIFKFIGDWINENPGRAVGVICGFIFSLLIFTIGILKTLLIILFMLAGYLIGKSRDEDVSIIDAIAGLFRKK